MRTELTHEEQAHLDEYHSKYPNAPYVSAEALLECINWCGEKETDKTPASAYLHTCGL